MQDIPLFIQKVLKIMRKVNSRWILVVTKVTIQLPLKKLGNNGGKCRFLENEP